MATGSNLSQRSNTEAEITPQLIRGKSRRSERCGGESPKLGPVHIARRGTRCIIQSPLRFFIHFSPLVFPPLCPRSRGREWTDCLSVCLYDLPRRAISPVVSTHPVHIVGPPCHFANCISPLCARRVFANYCAGKI